MYWTLDLATHLEDAPWPATKEELIDYAERTGAPLEVLENLRDMEDDGEPYESIEEVWPDYPTADDDLKSPTLMSEPEGLNTDKGPIKFDHIHLTDNL